MSTAGSGIPALPDHNKIIVERYGKIAALREAGQQPFAWKFEPTHHATQARANFDSLGMEDPMAEAPPEKVVAVAGRVMAIRKMGKAAFFHILDETGKIQIYVKKGILPDEQYDVFRGTIEMGDIVGISGVLFKTKTGEVSVLAKSLELLTKSARPLPSKFHGLKDTKIRLRQRYVDLIMNERARETFRARSATVKAMREMLEDRGYMEVETPMMQLIHGGAAAKPFVTHHNALDTDLYLRIAPELFLKRLVVGGFEKVYEINRNFRNEVFVNAPQSRIYDARTLHRLLGLPQHHGPHGRIAAADRP